MANPLPSRYVTSLVCNHRFGHYTTDVDADCDAFNVIKTLLYDSIGFLRHLDHVPW